MSLAFLKLAQTNKQEEKRRHPLYIGIIICLNTYARLDFCAVYNQA